MRSLILFLFLPFHSQAPDVHLISGYAAALVSASEKYVGILAWVVLLNNDDNGLAAIGTLNAMNNRVC
jgi:hypothetical protein